MLDTNIDVGGTALAIAAELARASPGERADARRMNAGGAPLYWRMVARRGIARADEEKWRRITRMLAMLTPASATRSIHGKGRALGAVLADGGDTARRLDQPVFSENPPRPADGRARALPLGRAGTRDPCPCPRPTRA